MKRYGSIDIDKNLKLRGVVVDDLTTQGSFYSEQFGEVAYKSELTGSGGSGTGFYGITVKHSNNSDSFKCINVVAFDVTDFYVTQNSPNTDEILVSLRDRTALNGATFVHTQAASSREWAVNHNLNTKNLIVQAFDSGDREIEYDEVDTSDPNIAYFYFIPAVTGKAIVTTGSGTTVSVSGGGGSPLEVTDGTNSYTGVTVINFSDNNFYLTSDASGEPVVNWDLKNGFQEVEIELNGDSKNIFWDWSQGNSFFMELEKNTTLHEPLNYKSRRAQTVTLITKQPNTGFYNLIFGRNYIFPGGDSEEYTTQDSNVLDAFSFHYSPRSEKILVFITNELFY